MVFLARVIIAIHRYLLPLFILLPSLLSYSPFRSTRRSRLTTEQVLAEALSDIDTFRALLPSTPQLPSCLNHIYIAIRVSAILFIPYTVITYLVSFPVMIAIVGTLVLSSRAPWAKAIYSILARSAYLRWALSRTWDMISGTTSTLVSAASFREGTVSSTPQPVPPVRFLFTILECQRWWVGLDWTAALLPGERPSWCTVSYQAITPPSVFVLPPVTSVFLPGRDGRRIKHMATWRWADPEWGVLVNKDGLGVKRVEKQPPSVMEDEEKDNASSRLKRAATMLKDRTSAIGNGSDKDKKEGESSTPAAIPDAEETVTDGDGWVYGDNKWEAPTAKGGMGKYTRFRRWTRVATVEETVEEVGPGPLGLIKDMPSLSHNGHKDAKSTIRDTYVMSELKPKDSTSSDPPASSSTSNSDVKPQVELTSTGNSTDSLSHSRSTALSPSLNGSPNIADKDLSKPDQSHFTKVLEDSGNAFRERLKNVVKNTRFE